MGAGENEQPEQIEIARGPGRRPGSQQEHERTVCKSRIACQLLTLRSQIDCEKLEKAQESIKKAREEISFFYQQLEKKEKKTNREKEGLKILKNLLKDKNDAHYFALMTKESRLDNNAKSNGDAIGYFQIRPKVVLPELQNYFGFLFTKDYVSGPVGNCAAGMMYHSLLRQHYVGKNKLFKSLSQKDKTFLTDAMYNAGPTLVKNLWEHLKPSDYADFEKKLSKILVKHLGTDQQAPTAQNDIPYKVQYLQYPGVDKYVELAIAGDKRLNDTILIGGQKLSLRKLGEVLRYVRIIKAIQECKHAKESPGEQFILRKEKFAEKKQLWSMAEDLRKELMRKKSKGISAGKTYEERILDRDFLIMAIERLNREHNPNFPKQNGDSNNIKFGTDIFIPNTVYLAIIKRDFKREDNVNEEKAEIEKKVEQQPQTPLAKIPLYKNPALEQLGNQILKNKYKLDFEKIEQGVNYSRECKRKRKTTNYIIIHSTSPPAFVEDRGFGPTVENRRAHYVVGRDGKIKVARDPEDNFDHAGRWTNRDGYTKTLWNGDGDISGHSIGIEVAAMPGEEFTNEQYEALKKLIYALGAKYNIQIKNILTHSQVACSRFGRGAKFDPTNVDWAKLDLPNNYLLVDREVMSGKLQPNFYSIERDYPATQPAQRENMIAGLRYSVALKKQYSEPLSEARRQTEAEWKKQMEKRGFKIYKVKRGDSLYGIARKFKTSADAIRVLNSMSSTDLQPGQKLKIPKRQR